MIPPCLTLSNVRYISKVKSRNPGEGVVSSPTPQYSSYWKGRLLVTHDYGRQLYFYLLICDSQRQKSISWNKCQECKAINEKLTRIFKMIGEKVLSGIDKGLRNSVLLEGPKYQGSQIRKISLLNSLKWINVL